MLDEASRALRRYNSMVDRNPPALAWRALGIRLWIASLVLAGDRRTLVRDRADDAHRRADAARAVRP
jgi:hypothetical protein